MALKIDNDGNITMIQGDTGRLVIDGLITDQNYDVYLAIQDENRRPIGNELSVKSNSQPIVVFELSSDLTDLLKVGQDEETHEYYYGIKTCTADGFEDTVIIGNGKMGDINTITVYPKKVEGINDK